MVEGDVLAGLNLEIISSARGAWDQVHNIVMGIDSAAFNSISLNNINILHFAISNRVIETLHSITRVTQIHVAPSSLHRPVRFFDRMPAQAHLRRRRRLVLLLWLLISECCVHGWLVQSSAYSQSSSRSAAAASQHLLHAYIDDGDD